MSARQKPVDMAEHRRAITALNARGQATREAKEAIRAVLAKTVARLVAAYPGRERAIEEALEGQASEMLTRRVRGAP